MYVYMYVCMYVCMYGYHVSNRLKCSSLQFHAASNRIYRPGGNLACLAIPSTVHTSNIIHTYLLTYIHTLQSTLITLIRT